jgi:hypothetical protein
MTFANFPFARPTAGLYPRPVQPGQLYNLRELMEIFQLYWASFVASQLRAYISECDQAEAAGKQLDTFHFEEIETAIRDAKQLCTNVGWENAERTIGNVLSPEHWPYSAKTYAALSAYLQTCRLALEQEFLDRLFLYVPPEDAKRFQTPLTGFTKSVEAFPSACKHMVNASRCQALGQHIACVFHCVGVLQYGLYALADELEVSFSFPLPMAEWCAIIDRSETKIKELRNQPRSQSKDEILKFYSEAASQFRYFKDAWRNHIAHLREEYDKRDADRVLSHTQEFMEHLSTRLKEQPLPALDLNPSPSSADNKP